MFDSGLKIGFGLRVLNIELSSVPNLQTKLKKYSARNICDIVFEKAKGCGGTVNRASVYADAAVRKVL